MSAPNTTAITTYTTKSTTNTNLTPIMLIISTMSWSVASTTAFMAINIFWVLFLMMDANRRPNSPFPLASLGLVCHIIPSAFFLGTAIIAECSIDPALIWVQALLAFRYWRTIVNIVFWFTYRPAVVTGDLKTKSGDCTVIVPTVGPSGNSVYDEMVTAILFNRPARLIFSTNTYAAADDVNAALPATIRAIAAGETAYQKQYGLGPFVIPTEIIVPNANVSDKREQVCHALNTVDTSILVMVDDTAIWDPKFLNAAMPAFDSEKVGFVGCRKWVKRFLQPRNPSLNLFAGLWDQYVRGCWNCMGGLYLVRHRQVPATNTIKTPC
jgi:hypothetical protein